jgi:hypothetical protein
MVSAIAYTRQANDENIKKSYKQLSDDLVKATTQYNAE